jgi:outer membrane protein insertion porin family
MGGLSTVRGFRSSSISPIVEDENSSIPIRIGGNEMLTNSFELNFPIVPDSGLRGSVFFDYGAIGLDNLDESRKSYGINFEWITPMAPLQFVFAWPIDPKDYDKVAEFEFMIGKTF